MCMRACACVVGAKRGVERREREIVGDAVILVGGRVRR